MMENNPIIARPIIDFEQQPHIAENGKIPYAAARDTYQNKVSKADHHIYISKKIDNEKTVVSARYLSEDEKVHAIAELFSGEIIPSEGLNTAKQFRTQARG